MNGIKKRFVALSLLSAVTSSAWSLPVFFNEIHYDNIGRDSGEAIEIAGLAGTDMSGWQMLLYNGSNGAVYNSRDLSGVIADEHNGYGVLSFDYSSIQNGGPDGFALVDDSGGVLQFLSYEGSFVATEGAAAGMNSVDIAVAESNSRTDSDYSLQLVGTGLDWMDFSWQTGLSSFGSVNNDQLFPLQEEETSAVSVPEPGALGLFAMGAAMLGFCRSRKKNA